MIPFLSVIVAAYTITRFISILNSKEENWFTKLFAVFAGLATVGALLQIIEAGSR